MLEGTITFDCIIEKGGRAPVTKSFTQEADLTLQEFRIFVTEEENLEGQVSFFLGPNGAEIDNHKTELCAILFSKTKQLVVRDDKTKAVAEGGLGEGGWGQSSNGAVAKATGGMGTGGRVENGKAYGGRGLGGEVEAEEGQGGKGIGGRFNNPGGQGKSGRGVGGRAVKVETTANGSAHEVK